MSISFLSSSVTIYVLVTFSPLLGEGDETIKKDNKDRKKDNNLINLAQESEFEST